MTASVVCTRDRGWNISQNFKSSDCTAFITMRLCCSQVCATLTRSKGRRRQQRQRQRQRQRNGQ